VELEALEVTNGSERFYRIERHLEEVARSQVLVSKSQEQASKSLEEMAARQHYHDEAFERHDAEMRVIREAIAADAENIRALARIAELHHQRLEDLEGGEAS
jgi:succinate dehydrogenase/fumarate reductase flavoprotein subunit